MKLTLAQVVQATGARISGNKTLPLEQTVQGWSIDSRTVAAGDLFFAIKGGTLDGHAFVSTAFEKGAAAAVVSEMGKGGDGVLLCVPDTLLALQQIASFAREQWGRHIVGVTGSAGKTSTKDIAAALLSVRFTVGKTVGNFNNHIGLPLSLLRIPDEAEVGVLEMGMNHAGEIRTLCKIARPQTGVVTNIGYAHVEAFDSIDGVAAAKRELVESLPETGVAVLNADDERVRQFRTFHRGQTITYGFSESADVRGKGWDGERFEVDGVVFQTSLSGRHSVLNILAAIAVAQSAGIPTAELVQAVRELQPGTMRGQRTVLRGITILNDSYNSNPEAARSMIDVLCGERAQRRIAVLGEMLELGQMAEKLHRDVGAYSAQSGIDILIGVAGESRSLVDGAKAAGLPNCSAYFFDDPEKAGLFLKGFAKPGDAILFKGSRGVHVERALARLEEE